MSRLYIVFRELRNLQKHLQQTVNRLWSIRLALASAYSQGQNEGDFIPRRLNTRKKEEQKTYEELLHALNRLISSKLDSASLNLATSEEDQQTVADIRKTIRYIQNAYNGEIQVGHAWSRLEKNFPSPTEH